MATPCLYTVHTFLVFIPPHQWFTRSRRSDSLGPDLTKAHALLVLGGSLDGVEGSEPHRRGRPGLQTTGRSPKKEHKLPFGWERWLGSPIQSVKCFLKNVLRVWFEMNGFHSLILPFVCLWNEWNPIQSGRRAAMKRLIVQVEKPQSWGS